MTQEKTMRICPLCYVVVSMESAKKKQCSNCMASFYHYKPKVVPVDFKPPESKKAVVKESEVVINSKNNEDYKSHQENSESSGIISIILGIIFMIIGVVAGISWIVFCFGSVLGVILILLFNPSLLFLPFGLSVYGLAVFQKGIDMIANPEKYKNDFSE